jgi:DNA-binding MarR family transcriptional regulator
MSIEKDIHQTRNFRNDHHKVVVNVIFSGNWVMEHMKHLLAEAGISAQQFNLLRILRGSKEPLTTLQIRERMLDKMSDTSRIVDRLIAKGLVTKKVNRNDKRLVDVTIHANGLKLLKQLDKLNPGIDAIAGNLSEKEARQLNKLLDKMRG